MSRLRNRLTKLAASDSAPLSGAARRIVGPRKVAFVLSGGGPLGAVQVGMLRALVEQGIKPDLILGCSVGAVNGAAFAAEPNLRGIQRLEHIWGRLADGETDLMENARLVPLIVELGRRGEAISSQDNLQKLLEEELRATKFADLKVQFGCVATDMETAREYWFTHGEIIPAVLASACLPGVYPPIERDGRRLYDGGVSRELPVGKAAEMGATAIYVLHVGHLEGRDVDLKRPFDALVHAYWASRIARIEDEMSDLPSHVAAHRLPAGDVPRIRFDDFSRSREMAEAAYEATSEFLDTQSG